ncbi:XopX family type III secretion system effector [Xylophilus ampelinus]|uniref:Type III secretion system effector protein n=1 Tax=Xylophilus ampelinus TaxID=54067 RepID=A0A318SH67_9BURK|nr:XopX family type III secretion system effector [Xylophilus ampelinus]MCS4510188.1 hypothetical protein [Xylophilus ampelinus]PYE78194.1 hypothetical protein DFQ15_109107 [Xylophilus ampelinus]
MHVRPTNPVTPSSPDAMQSHGDNEDANRAQQTSSQPATLLTNPSLGALGPRGSRHFSSASTSDTESYYDASDTFEALSPEIEAAQTQQTRAARPPASLVAQSMINGAQMLSGAVSNAASKLWSMMDLRTMLQIHADDPALLRILRGSDPEMGVEHTLTSCREQVEKLQHLIERTPDLAPRFRDQMLGDIKAVLDALRPLEHGMPATGRALKSLANLVNTWPLLVPSPWMADELKTFTYTLGAVIKGVLSISASALRPTTDGLPFPLMGGQLGRDANESHLYHALVNGMFLATVLPKKFGNEAVRHQADAIQNNMGYVAAASIACVAMVITPFFWSSLNALGERLQDGASRLGADIAQRAGFEAQAQQLRARLTPGTVTSEMRSQLTALYNRLNEGLEVFQQARRDFAGPDGGRELTKTLNAQCTHLLESLDKCSKRLSSTLQLDGFRPDGTLSISLPREPANDDFSSKLALALLSAAVTGITVYLIQPDRIGTVGLLTDTLIVTTVMMQSVFNKQSTRQDSMERFKAMCAGSMILALGLSAEKLSVTLANQSLIEASPSSPYYAGVAMTLMSMTMPGPIACGSETAMNWGGSQIMRMFNGPDGTPLATGMPSSPEQAQAQLQATTEYLRRLTPPELEAYHGIAAESMLQAIQSAHPQAEARRPSGVTITELPDEDDIAKHAEITE